MVDQSKTYHGHIKKEVGTQQDRACTFHHKNGYPKEGRVQRDQQDVWLDIGGIVIPTILEIIDM